METVLQTKQTRKETFSKEKLQDEMLERIEWIWFLLTTTLLFESDLIP